MKFRNQFLKYSVFAKDGEDGGEGGGGDAGKGGEDHTAVIADLKSQLSKVLAKNEELLTEAKNAKNTKREAEEAAIKAAQEAAAKAGDYESLYKSSQTALDSLKDQHEKLKVSIASEKRTNAAMKLAGELAEGSNAELLSEFISKRIRVTDEGVKVTDNKGELTISSLDDLKNEFLTDARFSALLKGNPASGGGASGGKQGGGAAPKQMTRADFASKNPADQMKFIQSGGTIIE